MKTSFHRRLVTRGFALGIVTTSLIGGLVVTTSQTANAMDVNRSTPKRKHSSHADDKRKALRRSTDDTIPARQRLRVESPEAQRTHPESEQFKKDGFLVWENTTLTEFDRMFPELLGINPEGLTNNCMACAVAASRTLAGQPTTARALPQSREEVAKLMYRLPGWKASNDLADVLVPLRHAKEGTQYLVIASWPVVGEKSQEETNLPAEDPAPRHWTGHSFNAIKQDGNAALVDPQTRSFAKMTWPQGTIFRYVRADHGVPLLKEAIDKDPGEWTSGSHAHTRLSDLLSGDLDGHGYIRAELDGRKVEYLVETSFIGDAIIEPIPGTGKDHTGNLPQAELWKLWDRLKAPQFKYVPEVDSEED